MTRRVCRVEDVPLGEGRGGDVDGRRRAVDGDGRRIAVFQTRTGWFALDQRCPHKGGPLTDGILADGCVICPLHDRRFDLANGRCVTDAPMRVAAYRVELHDGDVWVDAVALPDDGARAAAIAA
jgi:nitrite reductase (NADH) small subunit